VVASTKLLNPRGPSRIIGLSLNDASERIPVLAFYAILLLGVPKCARVSGWRQAFSLDLPFF
jgi:hypothetical protein